MNERPFCISTCALYNSHNLILKGFGFKEKKNESLCYLHMISIKKHFLFDKAM